MVLKGPQHDAILQMAYAGEGARDTRFPSLSWFVVVHARCFGPEGPLHDDILRMAYAGGGARATRGLRARRPQDSRRDAGATSRARAPATHGLGASQGLRALK